MGILSKLFGTGGGNAETFDYKCKTCLSTFEHADPNVGAVACEACGSMDVEKAGIA